MVDCYDEPSQMFQAGDFLDSMICFYTTGDPTMQLVVPTMIYGVILLSLYISTGTVLIPAVIGIIFAGMIFVVMPASATTIALVAVLVLLSLGGVILALRVQQP